MSSKGVMAFGRKQLLEAVLNVKTQQRASGIAKKFDRIDGYGLEPEAENSGNSEKARARRPQSRCGA
jgi:hypothetical protein